MTAPGRAGSTLRPNFLVIGAPKCATTSLCFCLGQHPEVFMSRPKETFFFSHDEVWARGWSWYESLFAGAGDAVARGEGTTVYAQTATFPHALPRIAEHLPHARIVYIVREPFSRLESHWIELHSQGLTMLPFARALREEPELLDAARYGTQLEAYRAHFPDDRILVLFYDDYRERPHEVLERCFRFLGVDPSVRTEAALRPRYASTDRWSDRGATNWLRRRAPGFYWLRDRAPAPLRRAARRLLKRPIAGRPAWDEATRRFVRDEIADDVRHFLARVGRPADHWSGLDGP